MSEASERITWGEFKTAMAAARVKDDDQIAFIDYSPITGKELPMITRNGAGEIEVTG